MRREFQDAGAWRTGPGVVDKHCCIRGGLDCRADGCRAGDVQGERYDPFIVPGARVTGRGINLPRAAGECFVDEVGADAAVGSGDEDDGDIQGGSFRSAPEPRPRGVAIQIQWRPGRRLHTARWSSCVLGAIPQRGAQTRGRSPIPCRSGHFGNLAVKP